MDTHRRAIITAIAALCAIAAQQAPAQSSGSFAGDFFAGGNGAQLISTITCSPGADLACSKSGSVFLGATIKMPGSRSKYLWIGASLETALLTQTGVTGGTGKQTSTATGSIVVTPEVRAPNGQAVPVYPPYVTFDERTQTLTANLSGCLTNLDPTTGLPVVTCTDSETVSLLLSTMSAHSYNFLVENYGTGTYTLKLHIAATATANTTSITAPAKVSVGVRVGSLGVQIVQVQTPFNSLCFDLVNNTSC